MLFYYFLAIIICMVAVRYLGLIIKRSLLICKVNERCKKCGYKVNFVRFPYKSVFIHDGDTDFLISENGEEIYKIHIITTPFRRAHYNFTTESCLNIMIANIMIARHAMHVLNPRAPGHNVAIDRALTIRKYKLSDHTTENVPEFILVHPVPLEISKLDGTQVVTLGNGDCVTPNCKLASLSYFNDSVLTGSQAEK